jgi:hypothetical protein
MQASSYISSVPSLSVVNRLHIMLVARPHLQPGLKPLLHLASSLAPG